MSLIIPHKYNRKLQRETTEAVIKTIKDTFQRRLAEELCLRRVTAPSLCCRAPASTTISTGGASCDLSCERSGDRRAEVVHSLAKWKRAKLGITT